jgi:hypothetical protein
METLPSPPLFLFLYYQNRAYYNSDFENVACNSWYEAKTLSYPSWTPGTEYEAANAAADAAATAAGQTGQQSATVFA